MPFPIIRNGYDELYVMSYKEYLRRKAAIMLAKKWLFEIKRRNKRFYFNNLVIFWNKRGILNVVISKRGENIWVEQEYMLTI